MQRNNPNLQDRFIATRTNADNEIANWRLTTEDHPQPSVYQQNLSLTLFNQPLSSGAGRTVRHAHHVYPSRKLLAEPASAIKPKNTVHTQLEISKILDAPSAINDFYSNYVDWGNDVLSIALGEDVYLWHPETQITTQLETPAYDNEMTPNPRLALHQIPRTNCLVAGTLNGKLETYDLSQNKYMNTLQMGNYRFVTIQSYTQNVLLAGTYCGSLIIIDDRLPTGAATMSCTPGAAVCGLATNDTLIAAGYGDNAVRVWDYRLLSQTLSIFDGHQASVKALQFSPGNNNRIATASGRGDHTVCLWNANTGKEIQRFTPKSTQTHPHITSLNWVANSENELTITIGNEIQLWAKATRSNDYTMQQNIAVHNGGHSAPRVVCATKDRKTGCIAAVYEDETLRLWKLFKPTKQAKENIDTSLMPSRMTIR